MTETTNYQPAANTETFNNSTLPKYPGSRVQPPVSGPVVLNQFAVNLKDFPCVLATEPDLVKKQHRHYFKDVSHLKEIDVYRVIELFGVTDSCLQHALKKLLVSGGRDGNKSKEQDVRDVIASCNRWLEMQAEDKR